jgi:hypothetical protein
MKIDHRNSEQPDGATDSKFRGGRAAYIELKDKIARMEADLAAGPPVSSFSPVRAGCRETLPGGWLYSHVEGPNLAKLGPQDAECSSANGKLW